MRYDQDCVKCQKPKDCPDYDLYVCGFIECEQEKPEEVVNEV